MMKLRLVKVAILVNNYSNTKKTKTKTKTKNKKTKLFFMCVKWIKNRKEKTLMDEH